MRLVDQATVNFRIIQVHLGRIADIVMTRARGCRRGPRRASAELSISPIRVRNVFYRYGVGEADVLKGASLRIEPGEMVALVGPPGGGKTTLMKIVDGIVRAGPWRGADRRAARLHLLAPAYRRSIGSIAQDDSLYAGSLAENIAFFDPEIDMARVEEAARLARIHDDIDRMPLRYDTLVGDMGSVLSGGQKQRVLLARALYGRPRMLFIDEGTAHLDPGDRGQGACPRFRASTSRAS